MIGNITVEICDFAQFLPTVMNTIYKYQSLQSLDQANIIEDFEKLKTISFKQLSFEARETDESC